MRTTLDLDDDLMRMLLSRHPGKSKTEAVEEAVREYLAMDANARVDDLRGSIQIEDVSEENRQRDRHT
ncbi:MAG: type II toxin-antitoxin system VapB family antitoxin [Actinomycetota bacterium]